MYVADMERYRKVTFCLFIFMLFLTTIWITGVTSVAAAELIWEKWVYSDGVPVSTSPLILEYGKRYRIEAREIFWYNYPDDLAADAQYYTKGPNNHWNWINSYPAPGGASFLQINGMNVSWGPFSNGDTGHTYSIHYYGNGAPAVFRIVDWMDGDYGNNVSHLVVSIYFDPPVGGTLLPVNKLLVLAPCLALVGLAGALSTVFAVTRKRKA